jgi:hypothetical protein
LDSHFLSLLNLKLKLLLFSSVSPPKGVSNTVQGWGGWGWGESWPKLLFSTCNFLPHVQVDLFHKTFISDNVGHFICVVHVHVMRNLRPPSVFQCLV